MKTVKERLPQTFILLISLAILFAGVWGFDYFSKPKRPAANTTLPVYGKISNFNLTERSGQEIRLSDLKGKIWIANFIFTRCAGVCPLMSQKMRQIQNEFTTENNLRFVSFSVDPEYDTPQKLSEYAERFEADPAKWFFLTGSKEQLFELSIQHFHLGVGDIPEAEREALGQTIRHSSKFVLVDGEGNIRGYYDTESPNGLYPLKQDIHHLLGKPTWN